MMFFNPEEALAIMADIMNGETANNAMLATIGEKIAFNDSDDSDD